jgi:hypothetical protein
MVAICAIFGLLSLKTASCRASRRSSRLPYTRPRLDHIGDCAND